MRRALALTLGLAAIALAGCDTVSSKTAIFGPADAAKSHLKPGLWAIEDGTCSFDESRPIDTWPDKCSAAVEVRAAELLLYQKVTDGPPKWNQADYLLVGGDPLLMQLHAADGDEFDFYVVNADRRDPDGRIVAAHVRAVTCGPAAKDPPASNAAPAPDPSGRTTPLYPGVTATGSLGCTPNGADGLWQAVKAGADQEAFPAHWVRDGDR